MSAPPRISVVIATRDRPVRLAAMLRSLDEQTVPREEREVIVVDDGSSLPEMQRILDEAERSGARVLRRASSGGPAAARNDGWRAATAPLIAFTDDDCVAASDWLERALSASTAHPGAIVQGRTDPVPEEAHLLSPFSRTRVIHELGPPFETCNVVYPRRLLEELGGFDETFPMPGGEDTDLAWRAIAAGTSSVFAPEARVYHAVLRLGPLGMLKDTQRWQHAVPVFARHPGLRTAQLHRGVFWSKGHADLLRFLIALPLVRRAPVVALVVAWPYLVYLLNRRTGPLLAPYLILHDLLETYAIVRGALRNRVLVI
jgi:glycosyltransferase involved in cell wall biosynthesis